MRRPTTAVTALAALSVAALAFGCAVDTSSDPAMAQTGVKRAVIVVERSAGADAPDAVKAEAFASFLSLPSELEPGDVLPIAELALDLPAPGACKTVSRNRRATPADAVAQAELLDAGEVTLVANGVVTTLAPRAFPSAADTISGVVYTTRDRAADPLPASSRYTVATSGSPALEPISVELGAPAALEGVTVMGSPFGNSTTLRSTQPVELGWTKGVAGDLVYVSLEGNRGSTLCAYRDDAGHGTLPATAVPSRGTAALSVHRLRTAPFTSVGLGRGELRFDFEVSGSVTVE